jgi:hypothetical protein
MTCPLRELTGVACPTCFLTRATAAALNGNLADSLQLHAFGPMVAATLIWWSFKALQQRRLVPYPLPGWPIGWGAITLLIYWLLRLWVTFGSGHRHALGFPMG